MSRQNYYKGRKARQRRAVDEEAAVELVKRERCQQPRLGTRKLHWLLEERFAQKRLSIGRDRLFEILRSRDMLVKPLRRSARTTNSKHKLPVFLNRIKKMEPTGPNQVWVSDITYIRTKEGFEYLSLITDMHSSKIVGFSCGADLSANGCLRALDQALASMPEGSKPIHHSDRGCQYSSHAYIGRLTEHGLEPSMTEEHHCGENAKAERLNGILKQEYGLGGFFRTRKQVRAAVKQAVWLYNNRRPHYTLKLRTPAEVHGSATRPFEASSQPVCDTSHCRGS